MCRNVNVVANCSKIPIHSSALIVIIVRSLLTMMTTIAGFGHWTLTYGFPFISAHSHNNEHIGFQYLANREDDEFHVCGRHPTAPFVALFEIRFWIKIHFWFLQILESFRNRDLFAFEAIIANECNNCKRNFISIFVPLEFVGFQIPFQYKFYCLQLTISISKRISISRS